MIIYDNGKKHILIIFSLLLTLNLFAEDTTFRQKKAEKRRILSCADILNAATKNFKNNDFIKTIQLLNKIIAMYPNKTSFLKSCPANISVLKLLAISNQKLKRYDNAQKFYNLALDVIIKQYGKDDFSVASVYFGLGDIALDLNDPDKAITSFNHGLKILKEHPNSDTVCTAKLLWGIAKAHSLKKDYAKAIIFAKKSLNANAKNPIPEQQAKLNAEINKWQQLNSSK